MAITPTYPGVYIEEIPSGVRTIAGVATSVAAFAGWASKGPADRAGLIFSWADFERQYGGLDPNSALGYSVYHFFTNGGQQAYIVRLAAADASAASVSLGDGTTNVLQVTAKNAGAWGNDYGVRIKRRSDDASRFQLSVILFGNGQESAVEVFDNLSMSADDARSVAGVVNATSLLVNAAPIGAPAAPPVDTLTPSPRLSGGADGTVLAPNTASFETALLATGTGLNHLDRIDLFNLLCVPGETTPTLLAQLEAFCRARRAFLIADAAAGDTFLSLQNGPPSALTGGDAINAAFYFPWVMAPDPLQENRTRPFPPCGFVAGLYAKTDTARGVSKAPAGVDASLGGAAGLAVNLTDAETGVLNVQAINCLRSFPVYGTVLWGARTLRGHNEVGSEWKYIPVRRLALFIEESLYRGTQWVVFEPNDDALWGQIRLNIGAFMQGLFRQGAFQGTSPRDAYFVKCDATTTTQQDIDLGIVNIVVGFAPLKPAEFVIIKIQQIAGQTAS